MGTRGSSFLETPVNEENVEAVINSLLQRERSVVKPGLERVRALLEEMGRPQDSFQSILVGGTNGKGSTATFLYNILLEAGLKAGCYRSPHLFSFTERFGLCGREFYLWSLAEGLETVRQATEWTIARWGRDMSPSPFEIMTALAFQLFKSEGVEWAVVEVGMGGRLDASNVLDPACSLTTNVSLEHQDFLGPTLLHIAREQAGIIRKGRPLFSTAEGVGLAVLQEETGRQGSRLHRVSGEEAAGYQLGLAGPHQQQNASLALAAARWLEEQGLVELGEEAVRRGLETARLPGRLQEVDTGSPGFTLLLDVAHNPAAARALRSHITERYPHHELVVQAGFQEDKDFSGFLRELFPAKGFILCPTSSDRSWSREDMEAAARELRRQGQQVEFVDTAQGFRDQLLSESQQLLLLLTGSHYTVKDFMSK